MGIRCAGETRDSVVAVATGTLQKRCAYPPVLILRCFLCIRERWTHVAAAKTESGGVGYIMKKAVLIVCVSIVAAVGLVVWFSPNFRANFPGNFKKTREVWFTPWRTSGLDPFYIKPKIAQVRNQPFGNSMVTIELLQNTEVRLEDLDGDWARIVVNDGTRGWVRTSVLARHPVAAETGRPAAPVKQPTPEKRSSAEPAAGTGSAAVAPSPPAQPEARTDTTAVPAHEPVVAAASPSAEPAVTQPVEVPSVPTVRTGQAGPLDIAPAAQRTVPAITPAAAAPAGAQPAKSTAPAPATKPTAEKPIVTPKPVVATPKPADVAKEQPVVSTPPAQPAPPPKKPAAQQPAPPKEIKCPRCGTTNVEGDRFCIYCREPLR